MPRVLHLSPALFDSAGIIIGGAERYALELARNMAKVVQTRLLSFADQAANLTIGDLNVTILGPSWYVRGQRLNPVHPRLISELAWADVVHCNQQFVVASTLSMIMCRLTGRRVFVTDCGGGGFDLSAFISTDRWYTGHLHLSRYSQTLHGHTSWPTSRVIYGGVDVDRFSPDIGVRREPLVVFAGRLLPHKGVDTLIEALPDGLTLEIIGRPHDNRYLSDLKRLARNKAVTFRHDCDDVALIEAYRRALCVVLPSTHKDLYGNTTKVPELLGQTLIEGMACGTPTLCTAVASMPEVVTDGVTGFVVAPDKTAELRTKLEWLRDHSAEAAVMGLAARERVLADFTWSKVVQRCLNAYSEGTDSDSLAPRWD